ncbi:transposase domain-containing protein, partial [Enterobacter hormaechei]
VLSTARKCLDYPWRFIMFFGSDHGGERGALLYGLIGTCRLNDIDPEAYLRHILSVLPEWPSNRVDELLPWNVVLTNK